MRRTQVITLAVLIFFLIVYIFLSRPRVLDANGEIHINTYRLAKAFFN